MAKNTSALANAFLWAASMAISFGVGEGLILQRPAEVVADTTVTASVVAFYVAYKTEKEVVEKLKREQSQKFNL